MSAFLAENFATIIVGLILAAVVVFIIIKVRRDKRAGKSSCGCKCSGCANAHICHSKQDI